MGLRDRIGRGARHRFERFNIVCAILLAGWIPSVLILWLSNTFLSQTLRSHLWNDRQTLTRLIAQLVGDDLSRTGGVVQYYATSPETARLAMANSSAAAQQWLNSNFYSHPRIDGMFMTDRDGRLIASIPQNHSLVGKDFESALWRTAAKDSKEPYLSDVRPRLIDDRLATQIVGPVRNADQGVVGYFGVSILVERLGQRLSPVSLPDQAVCQIVDQTGKFLFTGSFNPNATDPPPAREILRHILGGKPGQFENGHTLFSFSPIGSTGWVALIEQPKAVAFKSIDEWRTKITWLAAWLITATALFAWFAGLFVRQQTEAAHRLERELIHANTSKDQFLALLSHELRNPLSPVIAMVAELEEMVPRSAETDEALAVIRRNVELEARLIDDLLDVTRIARGKLQLTFEPTNVHDVVRRAHEICLKEIGAKQIETVFKFDAREMYVEGDPARLQQVFWNLIKNSVKFTPANGRISISTRNSSDHQIEIQISDTGIGIEPDKIDKIFNAFEQGQTAITRQFGGLGLGLAISKAMVEAHAGKITAISGGANQGATFTVTLETVASPPARGEPQSRVLNRSASGPEHRILLVDDHADTCAGMKMLLERRGYQITTAFSAGQALAKGLAEEFDLVISDIGLPDRSGYDLMRELRQRRGLRGIALSGYGAKSDISEAHDAGFSDHLTKPIDFGQLEESIRNVLEPEEPQ